MTTTTQWLMSEAPTSRRQAILGNAYRRFRAVIANPTALVGLIIVGLLIVFAMARP